jgi:hypothetical protein
VHAVTVDGSVVFIVFGNSLDGRRPTNLQTALVTWYASASELYFVTV